MWQPMSSTNSGQASGKCHKLSTPSSQKNRSPFALWSHKGTNELHPQLDRYGPKVETKGLSRCVRRLMCITHINFTKLIETQGPECTQLFFLCHTVAWHSHKIHLWDILVGNFCRIFDILAGSCGHFCGTLRHSVVGHSSGTSDYVSEHKERQCHIRLAALEESRKCMPPGQASHMMRTLAKPMVM